jgi:proteasome activator subunit 4
LYRYFAANATAEMLAEWRPMLCPFDGCMEDAIQYLSNFLPVHLPPEDHDRGFKLWLEEIMDLYTASTDGLYCETVS